MEIADIKDWNKFLTKDCSDLRTDFGFPCCAKQHTCFLGYKNPSENEDKCPNNLKLKDKSIKIVWFE